MGLYAMTNQLHTGSVVKQSFIIDVIYLRHDIF